MSIDRRRFLERVVTVGAGSALPGRLAAAPGGASARRFAAASGLPADTGQRAVQIPEDRFDAWIEVDADALAHNVGVVSRLTSGRPILAVVKNNAYGLGLGVAAELLAAHDAIAGFAVVKSEDAIALRESGVDRPVLLMGYAPDAALPELVASRVRLSLYLDDDARRIPDRVPSAGRIPAHVYLDTGMSRMGMPYHRALPWLTDLAESEAFSVTGTFMAFTEETDFDREQLARFQSVVGVARERGIELGRLHAASSNGVYHLPEAHLELVRPGIALFGGYPSRPEEERAVAELHPAVSLKCRVVRVERLREGDSVSYGRSYVAEGPTWVATLPAGHVDGYPRGAVRGARVAIGDTTYRVIGAVSASHLMVELGADPSVAVGDVATLLGSATEAVHPNEVARTSDSSVYDLFMHLDPTLPRIVV